MTTGQRLKEARKQAGMTQVELGVLLGVSGSMIAQYETDKRNPKYDTLERLADALDIPVEVLLGIGESISSTDGTKEKAAFDGSIRVQVSPEQRECSDLLKKDADGTITDAELQRLGELLAKRPLGETMGKLTTTLERMKQCLAPLNDTGQQKLVAHTEDYARDLAKIPEYRRQEAVGASPSPAGGTDTTPPEKPTETPPEGE